MNNRVISALALAMALAASSATVNAQSTAAPLPEGYGNASTELPEGYDTVGSQRPDGYQESNADSTKPEGYGSSTGTNVSDDMRATVEDLAKQNESMLTGGDEATACEVILCLSTGSPPGECASSLRKYFSINLSKPWKTIRARLNFLKLCPAAEESPQMSSLVEAMANGAGRCDAATLNQTLRISTGIDGEYEISNQLPAHCSAYIDHEYSTDMTATRATYLDKYVVRTIVDSEGNTTYQYDGGYWVDGGAAAKVAANDTNGAVPASKDPAAVGY